MSRATPPEPPRRRRPTRRLLLRAVVAIALGSSVWLLSDRMVERAADPGR